MNQKLLVGESLSVWCLENPNIPIRVGILSLASIGSGLLFKYDKYWIDNGYPLSGDLPLIDKRLISGRNMPFGAISDAMPDRWGQKAINYIENPIRSTTLDYLYYAGDRRFGMLGFSLDHDSYKPHANSPMPEFSNLSEMIALIEKIQNSDSDHLTPQEKLIVSTTSTMGGAHPKALTFIHGFEFISKFPRGEDIDISMVEFASMKLAEKAGIVVAQSHINKDYLGSVVSLKRFDRDGDRRIHSLSAFTAINHGVTPGGGSGESDMSYGAMAEFLQRHADPKIQEMQRKELFRRMAFNVLIDNTDDHGNNHAFLMVGPYWNLSPAYDVLPTRNNSGRHEMILGEYGSVNTLENILSSHSRFGMSKVEAMEIWVEVSSVVSNWKDEFKISGVSSVDIENLVQFIDEEVKVKLRNTSNISEKLKK